MAAFGVFNKAGHMVRSFAKRDEARVYAKAHGLKGPDYARRKALHAGEPLSVVRGHARPGEASIASLQRREIPLRERAKPEVLDKVYEVRNRMERGESFTRATKEVGISPSTARRLGEERGLFFHEYSKGQPRIGARTSKESWRSPWWDGQSAGWVFLDVDERNSRILAEYWADVYWAMEKREPARLEKYRGTVVRDIYGNKYSLVTDLDALYAWWESMTDAELRRFRSAFESP